jgi:hypothetical protein
MNIIAIVNAEVAEVWMMAGYSKNQLTEHILFKRFQERLEIIGRLTYRIQEAISEGVTSGEIGIALVAGGEGFDPETMDDTFSEDASGSANKGRGGPVAGTTDLGLTIQAARTSAPTILRKPKVVLSSAFGL